MSQGVKRHNFAPPESGYNDSERRQRKRYQDGYDDLDASGGGGFDDRLPPYLRQDRNPYNSGHSSYIPDLSYGRDGIKTGRYQQAGNSRPYYQPDHYHPNPPPPRPINNEFGFSDHQQYNRPRGGSQGGARGNPRGGQFQARRGRRGRYVGSGRGNEVVDTYEATTYDSSAQQHQDYQHNLMDTSATVFTESSGHQSLPKDSTTRPQIENNVLCRYWANSGDCRRLKTCRFRHSLRLIASHSKAHMRGIYCVCSATVEPTDEQIDLLRRAGGGKDDGTPPSTVVEVYSGSQDKSIKRWILSPTSFSNPNPTNLQLIHQSTISLDSACNSMCFAEDCLFAGLTSGAVVIFHRIEGLVATLMGHTTEVHCVKLIDRILISGDWSGRLQLWQPDAIEKTFKPSVTLEIGSPITCFIEVSSTLPNLEGGNSTQLLRYLWVGCNGSICIVDLLTLQLKKSIKIKPLSNAEGSTPQPVMSLLRYDQTVVACLLGGVIKVFSFDGEEVVESNVKDSLCTMEGSMSSEGPVLICGRPYGHVSTFSLPNVKEIVTFKYHEKEVRVVANIGGSPSYFITAGFEGNLNVWYWHKPQ